eukprot:5205872-Amphidinium_carterae.1
MSVIGALVTVVQLSCLRPSWHGAALWKMDAPSGNNGTSRTLEKRRTFNLNPPWSGSSQPPLPPTMHSYCAKHSSPKFRATNETLLFCKDPLLD